MVLGYLVQIILASCLHQKELIYQYFSNLKIHLIFSLLLKFMKKDFIKSKDVMSGEYSITLK